MEEEKEKKVAPEEETSEVPAEQNHAETGTGDAAAEHPADEEKTELPSDQELFAGQVTEDLSERQLFAGDEDFYKFLTKSAQSVADKSPFGAAAEAILPIIPTRYRRFSATQKILLAGIVLIAAVLLYGFLKSPSRLIISIAPPPGNGHIPDARRRPEAWQMSVLQQTVDPEASLPDSGTITLSNPQQSHAAFTPPGVDSISPDQPLSLKVAETFYLAEDYDKAYAAYSRLYECLVKKAEKELILDFLQFRAALCLKNHANLDHAACALKKIEHSDCPVLRMLANYHLSFIEMRKDKYLQARTRAYKTMALVDALDFDADWAESVRRNCHFLIAELMTRNVLSLCDAESDFPEELRAGFAPEDPFTGLDETQLNSVLKSGRNLLGKALLSPQIQQFRQQAASLPDQKPENTDSVIDTRWSVVCDGAPIDELLARFAANAGLDIHWVFTEKSATEQIDSPIRRRPVSLCLAAATPQQLATIAAGSTGLLVRLDDNGVLNVYNPLEYSSLSEHIELLRDEAVSLWRRFLLTYHTDKRGANAHFALGLLNAQKGLIAQAIAEYKIVAGHFSQSSPAPLALLQSSKLKANLRDYPGARVDLKQLVEQFPGTEIANQACLYLADATMKARLYGEAAKLYQKVYNLGLSLESQTVAALRAGICFYEQHDYEKAEKWLTRYISLARDSRSTDLSSAYLLLGKTSLQLGKLRPGCDALRLALAGQLPRQEYVDALSSAVTGYIRQKDFVTALDVLDNVKSWRLSQPESVEMLLLKSRVLRAMGLEDKALAELGDQAEYISDEQLKARILFEVTKCCIVSGQLEAAHKNLAQILVKAEPGPFAHEVAFELAGVCMKLGRDSQAISVCSQLLHLEPSQNLKQKTIDILARAYKRQKNYDKAASSLLGGLDS